MSGCFITNEDSSLLLRKVSKIKERKKKRFLSSRVKKDDPGLSLQLCICFLFFTFECFEAKGQDLLESRLIPPPPTNLSICAKNLVSKMPRVLSRSDTLPLSSRPLAVKSISTFLTISPKYMPLIIFSYLKAKAKLASHWKPSGIHGAPRSRRHLNMYQWMIFLKAALTQLGQKLCCDLMSAPPCSDVNNNAHTISVALVKRN